MKSVWWLALVLIVGGCSASPQKAAVPEASFAPVGTAGREDGSEKPSAGSVAAAPKPPAEDDDQERVRGDQDRRRPIARQNHDSDPNYHPPENLRGRYAGWDTAELKSAVARHCEILDKKYGYRNFTMRASTETEVGDPRGQQIFDELMELKQELCRRWKAGDKDARLVEFGT
jgi:hypothetical protein